MTVQELMNELNKYPRKSKVKIAFSYDCGYGFGYGYDIEVSMEDTGEVVIKSEDA